MGCQHSKNANICTEMNENGEKDNIAEVIVLDESDSKELTASQKQLIHETWKHLVDNISNVGVITFMNLFETHPDVQDVFMPFKGLTKEELRHSTELRAHGLRVMGFVQKVVARLDEPEKSEQLLRELGKNHVMYGAKIDYVDVRPQFVFAVKPSMKDHWSDDIEDAWIQLFKFMAYKMKKAMLESINNQNDSNQETNKEANTKQIEI
ncbi:globin C, coelomic-like isoform X2 [Parasteatoda tepidariorum]|uniref:globin C, coelomic-like isoform X2 n=1 Tax=Parasteatoda tepidariorum TaxID=114398 RepID=UPI0039BC4A14